MRARRIVLSLAKEHCGQVVEASGNVRMLLSPASSALSREPADADTLPLRIFLGERVRWLGCLGTTQRVDGMRQVASV